MVEITGRDALDYAVGLAGGTATWALGSYNTGSDVVISPTWTAVGVGTGLVLFAVLTFSAVGRRFQERMRESLLILGAVLVVGFLLVTWLSLAVDLIVRAEHYSGFLGLGLSQLPGIILYLRQRASGRTP